MFDLSQRSGVRKKKELNFSPFPEFSPSLLPGPRIDSLPRLRAQQQITSAPKFNFIPAHVPSQAPRPDSNPIVGENLFLNNFLPIRQNDNPLIKGLKGAANVGASVLSAPTEALRKFSIQGGNLLTGHGFQDLPKNTSFINDILPKGASNALGNFQQSHPVIGGIANMAIETAADPTAYLGTKAITNAFKMPTGMDLARKMVGETSLPKFNMAEANPSPKINKYSFTTGEQRAMSALDEGTQTAQNFIRHNDVLAPYPVGTTVENAFKDIKANTGVDLPQLTSNWDKAQSLKTSMAPEELRMGRIAGVIPDLKPREGLQPKFGGKSPSLGQPLQQVSKAETNNLSSPLRQAKSADSTPVMDYTAIKDITGFEGSSKDMYRILEQRLGKDAANHMMDPFTKSKGDYADLQSNLANEMKAKVVDGLGIKKGSKESALVQQYGEKTITLEELKVQAPNNWQNIIKADQWFREKYNTLVDQINTSKHEIYPNAEKTVAKIEQKITDAKTDTALTTTERRETLKNLQTNLDDAMRNKVVPKREDYYRHFQEMAQGFSGLKNIFENPTMIDPRLVGKTVWTKPKSKWASIAQKRLGNETKNDAVGGFLDYLPQASYAIHIDPHIPRFRALSDEIANATVDTKNANNLIQTLQNYANDLSGKTNPADRYMMENVPGGRTTVAALGWLQNRIKSNVILGNLGTAVSQLANIPSGIAFAKQYAAKGATKTLKTIFKPSEEMMQSPFLKERYGGPNSSVYQQFDTTLLSKPKQFAVWVLETADKLGSEFIWNSAYAKGAAEGETNLVKYADDATRKLVAGRGIGEVPLMYKSKIFGLIAPFQLEVGNLWHIQKDMVSSKDFAGLATLYLSMYLFNRGSEKVKGFGVTFDPIQAVIDASQPGLTPIQRGGRIGGELFSNVPFGQNVAKMAVPEYGGSANLPGSDITYTLPSRKELFGKNDPTRFGSGNLIADSLSLKDPLKAALNLFPSFGGGQALKTYKGVKALVDQGVYDKTGTKLSYPVNNSIPNLIKGPLFGPSGLSETKNYYDLNRRPLSPTQTKAVENSGNSQTTYEQIQMQRKLDALKAAQKAALKKGG